MTSKKTLIEEIETLPAHFVDEVYTFVGYLKMKMNTNNDITLASEDALARQWLSPEEDAAWADL